MIRITEAVKNNIEKLPSHKPEKEEKQNEEAKSFSSSPSISPSTVRVSELFKGKKTVTEDREVYKQLYNELLESAKEVMEKPKNNEAFDASDISAIVEKVINNLDNPNSSTFIELAINNCSVDEKNYLYAHSVNVCLLALKLGKALNMSKSELTELGTGAFLHDIGMSTIPQDILNKPDNLNDKEMNVIKNHPLKGCELLKNTKEEVAESISCIIAQHHEKINGKGYPQGLSEKHIHKFAKIIRLVDSYVAMIHSRQWREPFLPVEAIKQILDNEKDAYEHSLIKLLLKEVSIYPVGGCIVLNTQEIGKVVKVDYRAPMRPIVEIMFDPDGFRLEKTKFINLADRPLLYIDKACNNNKIC
jgi:putative nucleotidyltransferase with HDIG domain